MKTFKDLSSYWVAIIGIVKVQSCTYDYSGVGFPTYGKNFMKISQYKTVQFVNILTAQVFLLTENRVESVKKYVTYLNLQSTNAISNFALSRTFFPVPSAFTICFPIKCLVISNSAISNYSLSQTNFLVPRENTVAIAKFSENVAHRKQSTKVFSCVFERVCLIECCFN